MTSPEVPPAQADWLTPEIVAAVVGHMNADHGNDALLICRAVGGLPDATAARTTGVTMDAMSFVVETPVGSRVLDIQFSRSLTDRSQIRAEVLAWHQRANKVSRPG